MEQTKNTTHSIIAAIIALTSVTDIRQVFAAAYDKRKELNAGERASQAQVAEEKRARKAVLRAERDRVKREKVERAYAADEQAGTDALYSPGQAVRVVGHRDKALDGQIAMITKSLSVDRFEVSFPAYNGLTKTLNAIHLRPETK